MREILSRLVLFATLAGGIWFALDFQKRRAEELKEFEAYKIQEAKEINAKLKIERLKAERAEQQTVETGVAPLP